MVVEVETGGEAGVEAGVEADQWQVTQNNKFSTKKSERNKKWKEGEDQNLDKKQIENDEPFIWSSIPILSPDII